MKNQKYYQSQAKKILQMTIVDIEPTLKLIEKFNGIEEMEKIVSQFSAALAEV